MDTSALRATLSLSLMAAFADGDKHDRERDEIRRIAQGLGAEDAVHLPTLYQDVLLQRVTLADVAQALPERGARQLAYEMAVCVCDADGAVSPREQAFLAEARRTLALDGTAETFETQAHTLTEAPLAGPLALALAPTAAAGAAALASTPPESASARPPATVDDAELDDRILKSAITCGALELLPETLSTLAIIPLQMRLVYTIGQAHGYDLDRGHIKDFLATAGVGLTSQYLEQAGRKLLGGLLGKAGGGLLGGVGRQAVSSGMSFATTYALGHLAKRYYAGGRSFSPQMIKDSYARILEQGKGLQGRYLPQMQQQASQMDLGKVMALAKGWR
ncbi:TerB family tellurite resistance protein [uncultured Pseudacidovorax sp.]|uniref:YcjF family protein n=1 Tax=uncultured Pseudacidovorax sp. TaxID=679313 RepID=UPI0025E89980|nr:TerB family tellurite resistance protein [uncultured Pseudacidovorax sp.]